jgi:hypothetical protein
VDADGFAAAAFYSEEHSESSYSAQLALIAIGGAAIFIQSCTFTIENH